MIPTIGVMVGGYIIVRLCQVLLPPEHAGAAVFIKVVAGLALVFTVLSVALLLTSHT